MNLPDCVTCSASAELPTTPARDFQISPLEKAYLHYIHPVHELLSYSSQSEIEKLKAENDRLKSESQGTGCSRAPSQVSLSASPRQSMGLSQHSLNLTESTSLGEWCHRAAGQGPQPALRSLIQSPKISRSTDQMERRQACVHLGCVCVSGCASATNMSPTVRLLSCFAPAPQVLQAMSLSPLAHHAEFCLIHFKRLTCKLNAAYNPRGSRSHLGQWLGL